MVQKEVAERAASSAPHFNKLAASVGFWADARITQFVGRREFTPPPAVDSAILLLTTKPETYSIDQRSAYYRAVQAIFQQPRKTLANNLVEGIAKNHSLTSKPLLRERVLQFFEMHGLQPDARPQNLTVADVFAISQTFFT
jgi:16S rRNA (adenine1518-N6/adenine1519-N6)-dimethyltransferase